MDVIMYGLGRIGLPIALTIANSGLKIIGIDINRKLIKDLKNNKIPFFENNMSEILNNNLNKNFHPKYQEEDIQLEYKEAKYIIIAVGTGFAKYPEEPNLSILYSIIGQIIENGINNKTIILRVTLPIGTSEKIIKLIEKKTGYIEGNDFFFAFVPERIMEGRAMEEEKNLPKIIGATNDKCFNNVKKLFNKIGGEIIRVSNPRTAELIKLTDNSWRNTKFAFANELAFLANSINVDVIEVIKFSNKGYERNMIPFPGPVSGYCLGKDPYLLELSFKEIYNERGFNSLWYYGRKANDYLYDRITNKIKGINILIMGLSFKRDIDDYRYSHSFNIIEILLNNNKNIDIFDPFLNSNDYTNIPLNIINYITPIEKLNNLKKYDTIIICINHNLFQNKLIKDYIKKALKNNVRIIDLWNMYRDLISYDNYLCLGKNI